MAETPAIFEQIEAMHQQVREFVEHAEPDYKVAEIKADFTTSYKPKPIVIEEGVWPHQDFILTEITAQFRVNAYSGNDVLECKVYVFPDGKFYLADQAIHRYYI
jgi:hypothetical protein